jgi:hypothetical protein
MDVSCHMPFLPGTSLETAVIHTAQASSLFIIITTTATTTTSLHDSDEMLCILFI